jgi:Tfp pilus assembly protein PilO
MSIKLTSTHRLIIAVLLVVGLGIAFWTLALGPKRDEASKLSTQIEEVESSLASHRSEISQATEARHEFPVAYRQLVVLGKAVPADDDTASLLVQLNGIAGRAGVRFQDLVLAEGESEPAPPPVAAPEPAAGAPTSSQPASATEVAASTLPLGATIGPAGLAVMPYSLTFEGDFFGIADFIHGLDSLVEPKNSNVAVSGRLITIDGFSLSADQTKPFPALKGDFLVTTYLTPPAETPTGGATPAGPEPVTVAPASTTIGATP